MRSRPGELNPKAKLTTAIVRAIRRGTEPQQILAERYGVGPDQIWCIRARRTWKHVTDEDLPVAGHMDAAEAWRPLPLPGYEAIYEVSDLGNLRRRCAYLPRPLRRFRTNKRGYVFAVLSKSNKQHPVLVHRIVASAFVAGRTSSRRCVNHLNGVKADNRAVNLEWVTHRENTLHALKIGLVGRGERRHNAKLTDDAVRYIRASKETHRELAARFGVGKGTINKVRCGTLWTHVSSDQQLPPRSQK